MLGFSACNLPGFVTQNKFPVRFFFFLVIFFFDCNIDAKGFLDALLNASLIDVYTWTKANWIQFFLDKFFEGFEIFVQERLFKQNRIWIDLLDLGLIEDFIDNLGPSFPEKVISVIVQRFGKYPTIADLELKAEFSGCIGVSLHQNKGLWIDKEKSSK